MSSVVVTAEITKAYLEEAIDWDINGYPIKWNNTYPYNQPLCTGIVYFAAGYQAGRDTPLHQRRLKVIKITYNKFSAVTNDTVISALAKYVEMGV